jgi:predicted dehydrogenase
MINVGVVGYGYWGPNLVRNLSECDGARVVSISDLRPERRALAGRQHPGAALLENAQQLIADPGVDAVVVATPITSHFELVRAALRAGKHVLVEKPLAHSTEQAKALVDEALRAQVVLMVDHTFVYTGAVRKVKEILDSGELGRVYYFDSVRVNLGLVQADANVLWDLAPHDFAIMDYWLDKRPAAVSAFGSSHVNGLEDIAYVTLLFQDNTIAHVHVNWLAPAKIRRILVGGNRKMVVYDDMETSEKVKVYDKGVTVGATPDPYQTRVQYRMGDMFSPHVEAVEALRLECQHFVDCITKGQRPLTDGEAGLRVVELLEAAGRSLRMGGTPQPL